MIQFFSIIIIITVNILCQQVVGTTVLKIYRYPSTHQYVNVNPFVDEFLTLIDVGVINVNITEDQKFIRNSVTNLHKMIDLTRREQLINCLEEINKNTIETAHLFINNYNKPLNTTALAKMLPLFGGRDREFLSEFYRILFDIQRVIENFSDDFKTPSQVTKCK